MNQNDLSICHTYPSCDYGCVCVAYRKYVNGFLRFGHYGLFVYLGSDTDSFSIIGVDEI
jgi:hypothetical protein